MSMNKLALIRYLAIDAKLRLPGYHTLDDIIEFVAEKLGQDISRRQIQLDIQTMRYDQALSFEAPIEVVRHVPIGLPGRISHGRGTYKQATIRRAAKNKQGSYFYHYSDPEYSVARRLAEIAEHFNAPSQMSKAS